MAIFSFFWSEMFGFFIFSLRADIKSFSDHQKHYFIGSLICWKMTIKLDHCLIVIFQKIKAFHKSKLWVSETQDS